MEFEITISGLPEEIENEGREIFINDLESRIDLWLQTNFFLDTSCTIH